LESIENKQNEAAKEARPKKKTPHFSKKSVESVENKENETAKESQERKRATGRARKTR
jgi:hypothetical protein